MRAVGVELDGAGRADVGLGSRVALLAGVKCAIEASGIAVKASTPWRLA
jgi:hypothetical protein